jgi:hypothetical protein
VIVRKILLDRPVKIRKIPPPRFELEKFEICFVSI